MVQNFECNTQRGSIEQLYIALGITPVLHTVDLIECHIDWKPGELRTVMKIKVSCISPIYRAWCCEIFTLLWTGQSKVNILQKPRSKVAQNSSNPLFFLTALTAHTVQTEEFLFQNVAYRLTVYRTGDNPFMATFNSISFRTLLCMYVTS